MGKDREEYLWPVWKATQGVRLPSGKVHGVVDRRYKRNASSLKNRSRQDSVRSTSNMEGLLMVLLESFAECESLQCLSPHITETQLRFEVAQKSLQLGRRNPLSREQCIQVLRWTYPFGQHSQ